MKRVIYNQKGGVGKTSVSVNLAAAFAKAGKKTLVVDLDSQANSSCYLLGESARRISASITDFFDKTLNFQLFKATLDEYVVRTSFKQLFVIPASEELAELQNKLESRYKILKLAEALKELETNLEFDEIIIDTPPALNFYSMSALIAADRVLLPFDCDVFSADAVLKVKKTIDEIRNDLNANLELEGIVINQYNPQVKQHQRIIETLKANNLPICEPYLSSSVIMKESRAEAKPLPLWKPLHKLSVEYFALAKNLTEGISHTKAVRTSTSLKIPTTI